MLKQLLVKNFQSHSNTVLDLSPGVNVIFGRSTTGKSALVRAFRWMMRNRPAGNRFKSNFSEPSDPVRVEVKIADSGQRLYISKEGTGVRYGMPDLSFTGVGRSVPDQFTTTLNMDDLNVQTQLEPHYLITASPGEFAKAIDGITHTQEVDRALSKINSDIRQMHAAEDTLESSISEAREKLSVYDNIGALESNIRRANIAHAGVSKYAVKLLSVKLKAEEVVRLKACILDDEDNQKLKKALRNAAKMDTFVAEHATLYENLDEINRLDSKISLLRRTHTQCATWLARAARCGNKADKAERLLDLVYKYCAYADRHHRVHTHRLAAEAAVDNAMIEVEICPTCGQEIS